MELVLNTPLHLDSLWRPVLDVTRTVNHLGRLHVRIHKEIDRNDVNEEKYEMMLTAKLLPSLLGPKEFLCLLRSVCQYGWLHKENDSGNSSAKCTHIIIKA